MPDPNLTLQLLMQIDEAIQRIHWRFENIQTPEDFTRDRSGLVLDLALHRQQSLNAES
ncbi:MAG: hypothetical protein VKK80_02005 [Prochlorothrix sp.]|nr:hypothetical protein [Prochlorothrix sp.]